MIAVNLSALQFRRGGIENTVAEALETSGLDPSMLELELTESILIGDTENVALMKAFGLFNSGNICGADTLSGRVP